MSEFLQNGSWIIALTIGFVVAWLIQHFRAKAARAPKPEEVEAEAVEREASARENARFEQKVESLEASLASERQQLKESRDENSALTRKLAAAGERAAHLEKDLAERNEEMERIQKKMTADFELLANRIFEEKSKSFTERSKESIDKLLSPLGQRISDFRERVEKTHEQSVKDRAALVEQLRSLGELNTRMSEEARNLTTALKGQTKTQGNWGEMVLQTVLEKSGLVENREYVVQDSVRDEAGKLYYPDVVINLPDGKKLVIDSKVSLLAYEQAVNADDEDRRATALKEHATSVKAHVSELGKKRYDTLYSIQSPDFVLMFVPIEAAFSMALQHDEQIFDVAFRQNVVIVTPTTLLATLRTVANIWRQEKQAKNAIKIAEKSGALYDKFVRFIEDMNGIGQRIDQTNAAYRAAMNKLSDGTGNLVRRVEELKKLGAAAKKSLPENLQSEKEKELAP